MRRARNEASGGGGGDRESELQVLDKSLSGRCTRSGRIPAAKQGNGCASNARSVRKGPASAGCLIPSLAGRGALRDERSRSAGNGAQVLGLFEVLWYCHAQAKYRSRARSRAEEVVEGKAGEMFVLALPAPLTSLFRPEVKSRMAESPDHNASAPIRIHQPSPLAAEVSFSPQALASSLPDDSGPRSLEHERQYAATKRTEAQEDAEELHNFRELALERQRAMGGGSFASSAAGASHFEPFVGSRVGSPIPDKHGLGWPGALSRFWLLFPSPSPLTRLTPSLSFPPLIQARARSHASSRVPRKNSRARRSSPPRSRRSSSALARTRSATA